MENKQSPDIPGGKAGPGRPKGSVNRTTTLLKDAILKAAEGAGGKEGLIGYLQARADDQPGPFMALLGKALPMQSGGAGASDGRAPTTIS